MLAVIQEGLGLEREALAGYQKAVDLDPRFWWGWAQLGLHHAVHGNLSYVRDCVEKAFAIFPASPWIIGLLAGVLRDTGETARAEELLAQLPAGANGVAIALACFHLVRGEIDASLEWAVEAGGQRDPLFLSYLVRPFANRFRQSHKWPVFLTKMNLPEELRP